MLLHTYGVFIDASPCPLHSSGEFHTFRLPVPSLWPDILEKVKASGMNAVSVYTHMGLINPSPGVVDFNGFRALQPLFDAAKNAGIWIVLRPGNYCSNIPENNSNSNFQDLFVLHYYTWLLTN